ncbi:MAG: DUF4198 domain-containing protein [Sphingomonadales bacterium]
MKTSLKAMTALVALGLALPMAAEAHRSWLLPSTTVLSGDDPWITVDAAVSNDLFYFEHNPMRLDGLAITGPDGAEIQAENSATGKFRSTFDAHLTKPGTYKIAVASDGMMGRYKLNGEDKRWRGSADKLAEIPAGATDVEISQNQRRLETFVTAGAPNETALKTTGVGLELVPVTHPNDLFAGEEATFRLTLDGKPAAGLDVTVIPGGIRYRTQLNEMTLKTDAEGAFKVTWPEPGFYWISASARDAKPTVEKASRRSSSYAATVEVLPQ